MRLTESERQTIREVVSDLTGGRAQTIVFGSRLNEQDRGGDIDLLVEFREAVDQPARLAALIGARLETQLGEQRIDVLIGAPNLKHCRYTKAQVAMGPRCDKGRFRGQLCG